MYKLTRQEVSDKLKISTRSVDRYIKSGKLRSKKDGKVVYINQHDVDKLIGGNKSNQEIIIEKKSTKKNIDKKSLEKEDKNISGSLGLIYKDLRKEIQKKDELIQNLAIRVGKAEEIAKNSVTLIDFKKSQYLLEESKNGLYKDIKNIEEEKNRLKLELDYEKKSNIILIIFLVIILIIAGVIWFIKI